MNVKTKALVMVSLLMLILAGFFLVQGILEHNQDLARAVSDEEKTIDDTFADIQRYAFSPYRVRIRQMMRNRPEIVSAFADRDRERLYRLTLPLYKDLREANGYVHAVDFTLPDGTVFLRMQKPHDHGDKINLSRSIIRTVHEKKEQQAGYDVGRHGLMYWVAQPLFDGARYVGAVEIGIHVSQLTFALADRFRTEVTTVIEQEEWRKATGVKEGFRRFGRYVVMMNSGSIYTQLPDTFDFSRTQDSRILLNGKPHVLHICAGLLDHEGKQIGSILVAQDISEKIANRQEFVRNAAAVTVTSLGISFLFLYFTFGGLIGKFEEYANENRRAKEEVEQANSALEARVQERTEDLARVNNSLQEQHRFLQTIIESMTQPFYVIDAETYRIVLANSAAYGNLDRADATLTCYRMTHHRDKPCSGDDHPCAIKEVKRTGRPAVLEHVHMDQNGAEHINEIYAYPIQGADGAIRNVIEYCIDVTDRRKADEEKKKMLVQLNQMQKMEAIGALAGGIAHDFNNILAAMLGYADLARRRTSEGSDTRDMLCKVIEAGDRAKLLVRQILSFSRQTDQQLTPIKVQDVLYEALRLLRASIPSTIELRQNIDDGCDHVLADPTQIHQIIMNLGTNAYQAMREKGGVLAVSLRPVTVGGDTHRTASLVLPPGEYVKLEVSDTGHGMKPEIMKRIFDPYFTTKKPGEGTGMGLAVVHGIVKSHGGQVTVYSEPEVGTTFNVYLPQLKAAERAGHAQETGPAVELLPGGHERILFVDDEVQIAAMGRQMLENMGYRVVSCNDSLEALRVFQERPDAFDLVITDMTMPNLTGADLARQLLVIRRDIPIILCTGFSELINADKAREIGIREYLMKPLLAGEIAKAVRKVLSSATQPGAPIG
ncbi:MAG: ATP-binding protein [Nitrospirota bacterium]|nr:ATP-binding protein [Nitrospirota bacterium]